MIVPRVFKSRQRKRKNISIVLSSHEKGLAKASPFFNLFMYFLPIYFSMYSVCSNETFPFSILKIKVILGIVAISFFNP